MRSLLQILPPRSRSQARDSLWGVLVTLLYLFYERGGMATNMKKIRFSPLGLYMIGNAALFMAGFLALVIFGAQSYKSAVGVQTRNNRTRATLSYISSAVRAADASGAVRVEDSVLEDGIKTQVLVLEDGGTEYCLRIYCKNGSLVEEYSRKDEKLSPSAGSVVGETDCFEVKKDGQLLRVRTDDGSVLLHLRAE